MDALARLKWVFLSFGSIFSIASLAFAFCIAVSFLAVRQRRRRGHVRLGVLARAIFFKRIILHRSTLADVGYFFCNLFVFGSVIGWAILSSGTMADAVLRILTDCFGARTPVEAPDFVLRLGITLLLFLAYEFGYWLDHYLKHRAPFLWEFHKAHHSAQVLTPWTTFRVHPIDTLVFANIMAVTTGVIGGGATYVMGRQTPGYAVDGTNALLVAFVFAYVHLQHSQFWIPFTGALGRVLLSPAHHQIHHSTDPAHFNRNLGSCLAIWDWVFGTLAVPPAQSPGLTYGVEQGGVYPHSATQLLIAPVRNSIASLASKPQSWLRSGIRRTGSKRQSGQAMLQMARALSRSRKAL